MAIDTDSSGTLVANQLPGLLGILQPAGAATLDQLARGQDRRQLANAMLAAAAGLLTPSPNRYPLGPLQRLGAGLGAALGSYDRGAIPTGIFAALDGRRGLPHVGIEALGSGARPRRRSGAAADGAARLASGALQAAARLRAGGTLEPSGAAPSGRRRLRKFTGSLGRRLDHPASLPGGWELYGYEKQTGNPVYAGPGSELRVYA